MKRIKLVLFILSIILIAYTGLYIYVKYLIINNLPPSYEKEDNYIFSCYYTDLNEYPENEKALKEYMIEYYYKRFDGNQMVDCLLKTNFHFKIDSKNNVNYVYTNGIDFKDDKLNSIANVENLDFFNMLFIKGDILLFFTKRINIHKNDKEYLVD